MPGVLGLPKWYLALAILTAVSALSVHFSTWRECHMNLAVCKEIPALLRSEECDRIVREGCPSEPVIIPTAIGAFVGAVIGYHIGVKIKASLDKLRKRRAT